MRTKKAKKITTLVHFILDKSGSMDSIYDATIKGFNEYLATLKKSKDDIHFSLTLFDTFSIDTPYVDVPVERVPKLSRETYKPNGGTPLYDAVVDSTEALYERVKSDENLAVVVAIMTDGEENSSTKHDEKCLKKIIKKLEKKGNWTFTYMGANQDAWANASKMGISAGNTMAWASTTRGTATAFSDVAMASVNYAAFAGAGGGAGGSLNTKGFFSGDLDQTKDEDEDDLLKKLKKGGGSNGVA